MAEAAAPRGQGLATNNTIHGPTECLAFLMLTSSTRHGIVMEIRITFIHPRHRRCRSQHDELIHILFMHLLNRNNGRIGDRSQRN